MTVPLSNAPRPIDLSIELVDKLVTAADAWQATAALADAEQASRAQDFATQILNAIKRVDKERDEARQPHLAAAAAVQDAYRPLLARLRTCQKFIGAMLRDWNLAQERILLALRAEKQRKADEAARRAQDAIAKAEAAKTVADVTRAQRLADEAEAARKAAAAVPERAQTRGAVSGRVSSLRHTWRATAITDMPDAMMWAMESYPAELSEWLLMKASQAARGGQHEIPGFRVEEELS